MFNLYSVHMDGELWHEPDVFRPERHLNRDGQVVRSPYLNPFGIGTHFILHDDDLFRFELVGVRSMDWRYRQTRVSGQVAGHQHILPLRRGSS